ncbi:MAG: winged helix-turn-helix domain-containing protein [Microbacteriaceae bacterium]
MKPERPALSPLLRSDAQGMILAQLFMNPDDGFSLSDLARFAKTSVPKAMREIDRLLDAHLVTARMFGRSRLVRVNRSHTLFDAIKLIVSHSYGPAAVLPAALYGIDGLEQAFLFGPWAARLKREVGPEPTDVDLLLVGYVNRIEAARAAARVEGYLGRSVNVQFVGSSEWQNATTELTRDIKSKPMIELDLD